MQVSLVSTMTAENMPPTELLNKQAQWLEQYRLGLRISEQGKVVSVGDGIVWISGLPSVAMEDLLLFADGSQAMVFDLNETLIGAVLLHESESLSSGTVVYPSKHTLSVQVGDELLGRVIGPLGQPLDGRPAPDCKTRLPLERPSPPIVARDFVEKPLYTGIKVIDTLIPIGKGQRQLLIGDEGLGRSSIALDTVINQRGKSLYCIYVLIGQKRSTVVNTIETLRSYGALEYTTVVVAEATAYPACNTWRPLRAAPLPSTGCNRVKTPWSFMMTWPPMQKPIANYRYYCAAPLAARPIPATSSTCTRGCSSEPSSSTTISAARR